MLLSSYLAHLTLSGFRPATIKARRLCLEAFERSLAPRQLRDVTRLDVEQYLSRPLALGSRRAYRSHLRAFYSWAVEEGLLHTDPTAKIPNIRVRRGIPRPLSDSDLDRALLLADRRMRAWLLCMALAGLRCMEVAGLQPDDIVDSRSGLMLYLRETKGGAPATVPAHPEIIRALAAVPIRNGLWWTITPGTLSAAVNRHLHGCGIAGTAHSLRHFAGTAWYRASGHDLLTTATLMRHVNVDTTTIYAKISPERPGEVARSVTLRSVG